MNYHSEDVFDADVIIITLTHKDEGTPRALDSFLRQKTTLKTALLIIDDGTSILELGEDKRIVQAKIPQASVAVARNLGNAITKRLFKADAWIGRMDADDTFAYPNTIQSIYASIDQSKDWALAGNTLSENYEPIERVNKIDETLMNPETVINRLKRMSQGDKFAELPSCNLWKTHHQPRIITLLVNYSSNRDTTGKYSLRNFTPATILMEISQTQIRTQAST